MTTNDIPECGPARDRMVAEVVGWTHWAPMSKTLRPTPLDEDGAHPFNPSGSSGHAIAALEAWRLADPENRYWQIVASSAGEPRDVKAFHVCIFDQLAVWDADAATLPAAATAALLASRGDHA